MYWSFHIEFEDGSNPYYNFPCTRDRHLKALDKWKKSFDLELIKATGTMEFYRAKEKNHE